MRPKIVFLAVAVTTALGVGVAAHATDDAPAGDVAAAKRYVLAIGGMT